MSHFLRWQHLSLQVDSSLNQSYWSFPRLNRQYPEGNAGYNLDGRNLNDITSSNFSFTDTSFFPHPPKARVAYTHCGVMELYSPGDDQLCDYEEVKVVDAWERAFTTADKNFFGSYLVRTHRGS